MVREMWYIDKKHAILDVRIIAMCPIRVYTRNLNVANSEGDGSESSGEELRTQLFWVYFPEARRVLANTICYTGKNQASNLSFDDIFHKRYFSTRIEKISNTSNDREISEYTLNGLEAIMESEKLKLELLKMESDLWSY
jgi:gliding motility associated protien GldN